jgi:hypothetical protein
MQYYDDELTFICLFFTNITAIKAPKNPNPADMRIIAA